MVIGAGLLIILLVILLHIMSWPSFIYPCSFLPYAIPMDRDGICYAPERRFAQPRPAGFFFELRPLICHHLLKISVMASILPKGKHRPALLV